ncbi:MAG TPA: hypothetical protein VML75_04405 [Kofleriaceae bacterium]|nr:hypothetical protein [Kofleriaceae bacterium]
MQRYHAAILVAVLAIAACRNARPDANDSEPRREPAPTAPSDAQEVTVSGGGPILLGGPDSIFFTHVGKAEAVFIGTLLEAGEPPGFFSGYKLATQTLTYEVERVLRGDVDRPRMLVHQLIVARSPVLDGDKPALQPRYTRVGTRYIVAVGGTTEGKRVTYNENMAPLEATDANVAKVEQALGL